MLEKYKRGNNWPRRTYIPGAKEGKPAAVSTTCVGMQKRGMEGRTMVIGAD